MTDIERRNIGSDLLDLHNALIKSDVEDGFYSYFWDLDTCLASAYLLFKDGEDLKTLEQLRKARAILNHKDHGRVAEHLGFPKFLEDYLEYVIETIALG